MSSKRWNYLGVLAVVSVFACGCSTAGGDDDDGSNGALGSGGAAPGAPSAGAGGSTLAGVSGTGGSSPVSPNGSGGASPAASGTGGNAGVAGSGGVPAVGGTGGTSSVGDGGVMPGAHEDLGMGDGTDVITIGDSWMSLILVGIEPSLAKASGQTYRNYAVPGTLVLNEQIPGQYEDAKKMNPDIKTVVMTGGGNDILQSTCADEACNPIVDDVSARLTQLFMEMQADGVLDVVLIGYTYPDQQEKRESLDYSRMLDATNCTEDMTPRCHFLDSTMLDLTLRDGIHPDDAGYDLLGQTVWQIMQDKGVRR